MKQINFLKSLFSIFTLTALAVSLLSFTTRFGLDSYEIYLNNKIILKQTVNQPLSLRTLQLENANKNDQLKIIYRHCTKSGAGTNRSISVKDEKGNTLKRWTFANTTGADLNMVVPVSELLILEKTNTKHELSIHYTALELPAGEMLSKLHFK